MLDIEIEIDQLSYGVVERIITEYFDMGRPSSSNFPIGFSEDSYGTYSLSGTKSVGDFSIRIAKKTNGKYELMVSLIGKLKKI